ncbi:helicase associated domain protein [Mycobacterium xenopi 4042]|uniref:Helicase associated domain protein n=1 Tax=Mycobacterium xenopi 4042 TaxID=1299334 RepID=X8D9X0_MYCXE|nr:helicase associated domain protein [Mycobacterium xenopi 4042]
MLFQWASDQRREYAAGTLDAQRTAALESLPGWQWRPAGQRWEYGFAQLAEFAADTGQASPSQNYVTEQGYRLGSGSASSATRTRAASSTRSGRRHWSRCPDGSGTCWKPGGAPGWPSWPVSPPSTVTCVCPQLPHRWRGSTRQMGR